VGEDWLGKGRLFQKIRIQQEPIFRGDRDHLFIYPKRLNERAYGCVPGRESE
jgi:hypothetical protein